MIKVYDGNNSLRRRIFRVIPVPRQATTEQVLTLALRAFHITKDPSMHICEKSYIHINIYESLLSSLLIYMYIFFFFRKNLGNFYLTDLYAAEETELCDPTPVLNLNRQEGKRPAVFLRFK